MIYDIVYDKGTRLRVRAGKEAFTSVQVKKHLPKKKLMA